MNMTLSLFATHKQPSGIALVSATSPAAPQSKIEALTLGEVAAVAGGPQVQNNPDT